MNKIMPVILIINAVVLRFLLLGLLVLTPLHAGSAGVQAAQTLSCSAPADAAEQARCAALEGQILDATIFMRFTLSCGRHGASSGQTLAPSHATIVDSRTVLTHDHFSFLNNAACTLVALEIFPGRGERLAEITDPGLLSDLAGQLRPDPDGSRYQARTVIFPEPLFTVSTLVFEHFDGRPDAEVLAGWGELAEINWRTYPRQTYVQWMQPSTVELRGQALGLVVQKAVRVGASGGGVFRIVDGQIHHIGNVWATRQQDDTSVVALNLSATIQ